MITPNAADLLKRAESYLSALHGSVARHDNLAANLACAGCELRDQIVAALAAPAVPPEAVDRSAVLREAADALAAKYGVSNRAAAELRRMADETLGTPVKADGRGVCPVCDRKYAVTRAGLLPRHWAHIPGDRAGDGLYCRGVGDEPAASRMADEAQQPDTNQATLRDRIADVLAAADEMTWAPDFDKTLSPAYQSYQDRADAVLAVLPPTADPAEAPLSPYYSHEACGFHWHGRDGMDIPMRDGQPVCPRCELVRAEAEAHQYRTALQGAARRDAVVSPPPATNQATLLRAADTVEAMNEGCGQAKPCASCDAREDAAGELRRMAAEATVVPPPVLTEEGRLRARVEVLQQDSERDRGLAKVGARCMREGHQGLIESGRAVIEAWRFALSTALGLGTGAPWEAIHERVKELAEEPAVEAQQQPEGAAPGEAFDLADGPVRCPLCPNTVTLHTPNGARTHFTTVHPEQRVTGRGPGPWPLLVTDGAEAQQQTDTETPCGPAPDQCDAESGEPCDVHETERAHAEGEHAFCGVECETVLPSEHLRNAILSRAIPGSKGMLAELERRAAAGQTASSEGGVADEEQPTTAEVTCHRTAVSQPGKEADRA